VLPCQRGTHGRVRHVALNAPEPFPKPLEPRRGHPPRLWRDFAEGSGSATAPMTGRWPLDLRRPSKIWRSGFNQSRSNLNRLIQIQSFPTLSLTRAPAAGPGLSALPWFADTPSPLVRARRTPAPARSTARSNLGRPLGIVRSRVPDTHSCGNFVKETLGLFGINLTS
jgi:hypothetical protein